MPFYLILTYLILIPSITHSQQLFTEVALDEGIDITTDHMFWGSGISFYDWDKDGWVDISCCTSGQPPRFFHNEGGTFVEVSFNIPNTAEAKHLLWADYDNDGDADIFLTRAYGPWSLYRNNGNQNFTDVTNQVGISNLPNGLLAHAMGAAWCDVNLDGYLDLYICNYHGPDELTTNLFFVNQNGTSFSEMAEASGIDDGYKISFQPAFFDANLDGFPDLHVLNDRYPYENTFYLNNGNLNFEDYTVPSGLGVFIDPMSNSPGDYDNDGDLDIYVSNNDIAYQQNPGGNFLFNNDGDANFTVVDNDTAHTVWLFSWGSQWIDQDLDGDLDLFVTTSPIDNNAQVFSNHFARNNGDGTFEYRSDSGMEDFVTRSYCVAKGDYNNDGAPDLVVSGKAPYRHELWKNNSVGHTYIKLSLEGTVSNRDAIGSTVYCYSNGIQQMTYTTCGEAYLSQNSQYPVFGLNGSTSVDSLIIRWPNGLVEKHYDIPSNQTIHLVEGNLPVQVNQPETLPEAISVQTDRILLKQALQSLSVINLQGKEVLHWNNAAEGREYDLDKLQSGVYILRWTRKNSIITESQKVSIIH